MGILSFIEKQTICRLFGISDGYVFKYWSDNGKYNKNITRQLILEACNIDIYKDLPYKNLSQQKCIEKIWESTTPQLIASLLKSLSDYFCFGMGTDNWVDDDWHDYQQVEEIIKRLRSTRSINLPYQESQDLNLILRDIETNIALGKPELVIDRLHTFATEYFQTLCSDHNIDIADNNGDYYSLDSLVAKLKNWYNSENYFESEFCLVAIRNTINVFAKYNDLRNSRSAAHPNQLLRTAEAEYAVKIVSDTLMFIDKIEKSKKKNDIPRDDGILYGETDRELPF